MNKLVKMVLEVIENINKVELENNTGEIKVITNVLGGLEKETGNNIRPKNFL